MSSNEILTNLAHELSDAYTLEALELALAFKKKDREGSVVKKMRRLQDALESFSSDEHDVIAEVLMHSGMHRRLYNTFFTKLSETDLKSIKKHFEEELSLIEKEWGMITVFELLNEQFGEDWLQQIILPNQAAKLFEMHFKSGGLHDKLQKLISIMADEPLDNKLMFIQNIACLAQVGDEK